MKRLIDRWLFWDEMASQSASIIDATRGHDEFERYSHLMAWCLRRKIQVEYEMFGELKQYDNE